MDKTILKLPLDNYMIEENIQRVIEEKPLTIPLKILKQDKRFIKKINQYIKLKKIRNCPRCNNIIKSPFIRYCSNECRKKEIEKRYNNPKNRNKRNKRFREYHKRMKIESKDYMIRIRIRDRLRDALRHFSKTGKTRKSNEYLDYKSIINVLGPCPGDRKDYHIDHIKPLSSLILMILKKLKKLLHHLIINGYWLMIILKKVKK